MDLFGNEASPLEVNQSKAEEGVPAKTIAVPALFEHPRDMPFYRGHEGVTKYFIEHIHNGTMPHAVALTGMKGIGKATFAYNLIRALLHSRSGETLESLDVPLDSKAFRQVASRGHPDCRVVERRFDDSKGRQKAGVEIEDIRNIQPFLRLKSSDDGWRIVMIDDADTMNANAQNALLKILEEPPPRSLIILVVHRLGALLPTIKSRIQIVNFSPLDAQALNDLLMQAAPELSPESRTNLAVLAQGSLGQALNYHRLQANDMLSNITRSFSGDAAVNWSDVHALADVIGGKGRDEDFRLFCDLIEKMMRQYLSARARGVESAENSLLPVPVARLWANRSLASLMKICDNLNERLRDTLTANLDRRQAVIGTFAELRN